MWSTMHVPGEVSNSTESQSSLVTGHGRSPGGTDLDFLSEPPVGRESNMFALFHPPGAPSAAEQDALTLISQQRADTLISCLPDSPVVPSLPVTSCPINPYLLYFSSLTYNLMEGIIFHPVMYAHFTLQQML